MNYLGDVILQLCFYGDSYHKQDLVSICDGALVTVSHEVPIILSYNEIINEIKIMLLWAGLLFAHTHESEEPGGLTRVRHD